MWCLHVTLISAAGSDRRKMVEIIKCRWSLCLDKGNLLQTEYKSSQKSGHFNSLAFCFLINPGFLFATLIFTWIWMPFITVCTAEYTPEHDSGAAWPKWENSSLFKRQNRFCKLCFLPSHFTGLFEQKVIWILCSPALDRVQAINQAGNTQGTSQCLQWLHYTHRSGKEGFVMMQPHNAAFAVTSPGLSTEARQSISAWPCPSCPLSCQAQLGEHLLQQSRRTQLIHCSREQLTHGQMKKCRLGDGQSGVYGFGEQTNAIRLM